MIIGQKVKVLRPKGYNATQPGMSPPDYIEGRVVYQNRYFVTIRTKAGYCESVLHWDLARMEVGECYKHERRST